MFSVNFSETPNTLLYNILLISIRLTLINKYRFTSYSYNLNPNMLLSQTLFYYPWINSKLRIHNVFK